MKVKEFVKTILKDVTEAVAESNNKKYSFYLPNSDKDGIDFDLAVTLKEGKKGKIGAEILTIIGAKAQKSISEEVVNRIKFKVLAYKINK